MATAVATPTRAPQQVRWRKQQTLQLASGASAGAVDAKDLSRAMVYRELYLRLSGTASATSAITPSVLKNGDEWSLITKIEIVANGTQPIRSISGLELKMLNALWYRKTGRLTEGWKGTGATSVDFDSTLILPFWMPDSRRPIDTALDARTLSSLQVRVTWGDKASLLGTATGAAISDVALEVSSLESYGLDGPFGQCVNYRKTATAVDISTNYQMQLSVNQVYRSFLIHCAETSGADDADYLNNIRLKAGTTVFLDVPAKVARDAFLLRNGIDLETLCVSDDFDINGWYYVDLVTDGYLTEALDSMGFSELVLELDVGTKIPVLDVVPITVVPVRRK